MGSASTSVSTFSLSNLSYIKSGKRKKNEKEIISSTLAPSSSKKFSPKNQTTNTSVPSKYKIHNETDQGFNKDEGDTLTLSNRNNSTKQQQHHVKKDVLNSETEEIKEISKLNDFHEYNNHKLPLIIGDTVHILEENGEGKVNIETFMNITLA